MESIIISANIDIHYNLNEGVLMELDKLGRDKMFYRICDIDIPMMENKEDVLRDMSKITNPDFQDKNGVSYLHMACQAHSIEAIKILLDLGANPNLNDKYGASPITSALGRLNDNNPEILEIMLRNGLDLNKKEGTQTLKDWIMMFNDEELNKIVRKYS